MSNMDRNGILVDEGEKFLDGSLFAKMAQGGAAQLRANADEVNNLNVFPVPDGDTGDNMSMTIESGVAAMERVDSSSLTEVCSNPFPSSSAVWQRDLSRSTVQMHRL